LSEKVVLFCHITPDLKKALQKKANEERRSVNGLVQVILEREVCNTVNEKAKEFKKIEKLAGHVS
jgi:hypothetical protein